MPKPRNVGGGMASSGLGTQATTQLPGIQTQSSGLGSRLGTQHTGS